MCRAKQTIEKYANHLIPSKVFQCLLIGGENQGEEALRNAEQFVISNEEFQSFLDRHSGISCLVPESNVKMRNSYLILDERVKLIITPSKYRANFFDFLIIRCAFWTVREGRRRRRRHCWTSAWKRQSAGADSTRKCSSSAAASTLGANPKCPPPNSTGDSLLCVILLNSRLIIEITKRDNKKKLPVVISPSFILISLIFAAIAQLRAFRSFDPTRSDVHHQLFFIHILMFCF